MADSLLTDDRLKPQHWSAAAYTMRWLKLRYEIGRWVRCPECGTVLVGRRCPRCDRYE